KPPMVLGAEEEGAAQAPQVPAVLSAADAPDELRATVSAALVQRDPPATEQLVTLLRAADAATLRLISQVAKEVVGPKDRELALGLLEQLRQVASGGSAD
ncbi:MAG TPA: hypothetical protein VF897_21295, partial [Roseiflexaceae bacterium]